MATKRDAKAKAAAWKRGETALETRIVQPMSPERVRSIRKRVAPP